MQQTITINQELLQQAMKLTGLPNATSTVEQALQKTIKLKKQAKVKKFRGKLKWEGDLEAMRADRVESDRL